MSGEIINRVANSPLITFNLETYYPEGARILIDIKDQLFQGLILREKDFRTYVKEHDWSQYQDSYVAITCSADAIVPIWAYMLLTTRLEGVAKYVTFGTLETLETEIFKAILSELDVEMFRDKPVVIKGCANVPIPTAVYVEATRIIKPIAKKLMYGEPCSTVPLYKRPVTK